VTPVCVTISDIVIYSEELDLCTGPWLLSCISQYVSSTLWLIWWWNACEVACHEAIQSASHILCYCSQFAVLRIAIWGNQVYTALILTAQQLGTCDVRQEITKNAISIQLRLQGSADGGPLCILSLWGGVDCPDPQSKWKKYVRMESCKSDIPSTDWQTDRQTGVHCGSRDVSQVVTLTESLLGRHHGYHNEHPSVCLYVCQSVLRRPYSVCHFCNSPYVDDNDGD